MPPIILLEAVEAWLIVCTTLVAFCTYQSMLDYIKTVKMIMNTCSERKHDNAASMHQKPALFSLHTNQITGVAPGLAVSHWLSGERTSGKRQPSADTVDAVMK